MSPESPEEKVVPLENWKPYLAHGPLGIDIPVHIYLADIRKAMTPRATSDQMARFEEQYQLATTHARLALRNILIIVNEITGEGTAKPQEAVQQ